MSKHVPGKHMLRHVPVKHVWQPGAMPRSTMLPRGHPEVYHAAEVPSRGLPCCRGAIPRSLLPHRPAWPLPHRAEVCPALPELLALPPYPELLSLPHLASSLTLTSMAARCLPEFYLLVYLLLYLPCCCRGAVPRPLPSSCFLRYLLYLLYLLSPAVPCCRVTKTFLL